MGYRYRSDLTAADVAFEADGKTLEELFKNAALALTNTMIDNPKIIGKAIERKLVMGAESEERLLHDFLDEILFYKDAESLLFGNFTISISEKIPSASGKRDLSLEATMTGEEIDNKKHHMIVDAKAVSWHKFKLEQGKRGWKAVVIVDV